MIARAMMFRVEIDGRPLSAEIEAGTPCAAAEEFAMADAPGWSAGRYRDDQAIVIVTDECGCESAFLLEGDRASFAAWYLRG